MEQAIHRFNDLERFAARTLPQVSNLELGGAVAEDENVTTSPKGGAAVAVNKMSPIKFPPFKFRPQWPH